MLKNASCPCNSGRSFADCCGTSLNDLHAAKTAEQLMRSRYTAYTLLREDYLLATWHSSTRPEKLELATDPVKWIGLKILNCEAGQAADTRGAVTFEARYKVNGKAHKMRETSQFVFEDGHWFYVSGTHAQ